MIEQEPNGDGGRGLPCHRPIIDLDPGRAVYLLTELGELAIDGDAPVANPALDLAAGPKPRPG